MHARLPYRQIVAGPQCVKHRTCSRGVMKAIPRFLIISSLLTISIWGIIAARPVLLPLSLAVLVAFLMAGPVHALRKLKFPEPLALATTFLLFVLPLGFISYELLRQLHGLSHDLPHIQQFAQGKLNELSHSPLVSRFGGVPDLNLSDLQQKLSDYLAKKGESEAGWILRSLILFLEAGGQVVLVMLFSILMVASRDRMARSCHSLIPQENLLDSVILVVQRFLSVRLGIGLGVACVDWVLLAAFGIPYSLLAGVFLGVMTLIPVIGFMFGVLPPLLIALADGISNGRIIGFFCGLLVVSGLESHLLTPKLLGRHLNLNLLSAFLGLFIGEKIWGAWGIVLSLPVLGIMRIILNASLGTRTWGNLLAEKENQDIKNAA